MRETQTGLKNFLLGNLDEKSDEEIGLRIISNEIGENEILAAENDLIEDFLEKNLSPKEEKLFYENFLHCEERRESVREIYLLKKYAKEHSRKNISGEGEKSSAEGFWEKIRGFFDINRRYLVPVAGILIAALLFVIVWSVFISQPIYELSALEKEYSELNRQNLENPAQFSGLSNVNLISEVYRNAGAENNLKPENLTDKILFRLALPDNFGENDSLKAELLKDQKIVFTQPQIRSYANPNGREVRLLLPKSVLAKGRYQVKIEDVKTGASPLTYGFAVE